MIWQKAKETINKKPIKHLVHENINGLDYDVFKINGYEVVLKEEALVFTDDLGQETSKLVTLKCFCSCNRGAMINTKYRVDCKHILVAKYLRMGRELIKK